MIIAKKVNKISIVIPCYNESLEILNDTISVIHKSLEVKGVEFEIIVVNDGSLEVIQESDLKTPANLVTHQKNKGYGASLKTGIKNAKYDWIGITDADGTYPNNLFGELIDRSEGMDMVIGARKWADISWTRKIPKKVLTSFASFLTGQNIPDLNSGMRIFKKELAVQFWNLLPKGFSFTSTITIGALTNDNEVSFYEINYYKRIGKSSISPFQDTIVFFTLVTRLALYFNPKKVFVPASMVFMLLAILRGIRDYRLEGSLGGLTLILFFFSFQFFFFGLIAEIINKTRRFIVSNKNI
ncbi:glycosyltransferase family 2 protein [Algoriphagus aquimarinus]|uniref:Glycosyltransferase involved in cell wall bisynthesis n=1 Tax=Algoriphagus aquimarinus TaxID=237018 RepID=A0A1I1CI46_9BACT|nr:glycosyltransferase family 2 protein [Algoriphagus aquimarinus]SFB60103.1 Glycosyltransferase involved in cell wall bisynthesis [Algoriphagus aquimarinus]